MSNLLRVASYLIGRAKTDLNNWAHPYRLGADPVFVQGVKYEGEAQNEEFATHLASLPWLTYRSNMPVFPGTSTNSDAGWGCTIRSAQMMAASALKTTLEEEVIPLFHDSLEAPLGIHRIVASLRASDPDYSPGQWTGPGAATRAVGKLLEDLNVIGVVFASDQVLARTEIDQKLALHPSLVLLASTTLPSRRDFTLFDESRRSAVLKLMQLPQFNGIVGGELLSQSFFFVGASKDFLFYLDPHTVQPALTEDQTANSQPNILRMQWEKLNPSMTFSFVLKSRDELEPVAAALAAIGFDVMDSRPEFEIDDEDLFEEETGVEEIARKSHLEAEEAGESSGPVYYTRRQLAECSLERAMVYLGNKPDFVIPARKKSVKVIKLKSRENFRVKFLRCYTEDQVLAAGDVFLLYLPSGYRADEGEESRLHDSNKVVRLVSASGRLASVKVYYGEEELDIAIRSREPFIYLPSAELELKQEYRFKASRSGSH